MSRTIVFAVLLAAGRVSAVDQRCPMNATEPAPANARLDGDVLRAGPMSYPPSAYRTTADGFELCACETKPCVRKCCKPGMYMNETTKCVEFEDLVANHSRFSVPKFVNSSDMYNMYEENYFHIVYGKFSCGTDNKKYLLEPSSLNFNNDFSINEIGELLKPTGELIAPPGQFCLEKWSEFDFYILPLVCFTQNERKTNKLQTFGMIFSLPFLLITFLIYALMKDLRNLHGKSLMCYVSTIIVGYTSLIFEKFFFNVFENISCIILTYICQFSFLASFFWLNVMCFDLWWTFRPIKENFKERETMKFILFSVYAWGCSIIIVVLTVCMDSWPNVLSFITRPGIGNKRCWFDLSALLLYFYGPISILLFGNVLMFIHTAIIIKNHARNTKVLNGPENNKNANYEKQRFIVYLKLFIIMGINWITEIISWSLENEKMYIIWYITDCINALQGVSIFFIFVCKKRVLILLNKKLDLRFEFIKTSTSTSNKITNISSTSKNNSDIQHKDSFNMNE